MTHYYQIKEELNDICGGNPAGAAVVGGLTCAVGGIKLGSRIGPWGAVIGGVGSAAVCGYLAYKAS
ncbi:TPA: bacteriocin BlpN, partial [Streptococcus equi subsp. zooepidemicus]|nr:bacteriocin BlpN [Streptococcus equi subsp. zooepidemicus]